MRPLRTAIAACAIAFAATATASAHDPREGSERLAGAVDGVNLPVVTSPNVRLLTTFPETGAISGEHAVTGNFFYTSSLDSISVFDTSNPKAPRLRGTIGNLVFENEAMTYGERKNAAGVLERFVLVGNDLYNFNVDRTAGPSRGRVGGLEVLVIDVTDPDNPRLRARTPMSAAGAVTSSTHTVQCVTVSCETAYTAGSNGKFGILDLSNLDKPVELKTAPSAAAGRNPVFTGGAGHYWNVDQKGLAWHSGSGGSAVFDITDPRNPVQLATTNGDSRKGPLNDFIFHNSKRPNAAAFKPGQEPSLANGNVLVVTEEDYANDGDEVACAEAGSTQTWLVGTETDKDSITPLDSSNVVDEFGGGLSTPIGGFCSAHWFDDHQSGIMAQGYYQQGLRFVDVRDPKNIKQYGYFTGGASEVWDAYWVPQRDANGVQTGKKTNVVYTADAVRGVDVFEVDLPADIVPNAPTAKKAKKPKK